LGAALGAALGDPGALAVWAEAQATAPLSKAAKAPWRREKFMVFFRSKKSEADKPRGSCIVNNAIYDIPKSIKT
jgi:hypothetical protein